MSQRAKGQRTLAQTAAQKVSKGSALFIKNLLYANSTPNCSTQDSGFSVNQIRLTEAS